MQINFVKKAMRCMRPILTQVQSQEQTQELKLPDGYPDVGKILGCWGQVVLRGKEWRRSSMSASGGVMAWVMYLPEDGTEPRVLDGWMPFQNRWELPENADDGLMCVMPQLSELDARNISARKIILRAGVDLLGQAMQEVSVDTTIAGDVPEDVQLLTRNYPVELAIEAGERQVRIEETIDIPSDKPEISRVISYELIPSVTEQKVLANRLVFRGAALLKLRYLSEGGSIQLWTYEIPFSDYTELNQDYDVSASAWIMPVVTALEVDILDNKQLQVRGGIAAQYTIFDRMMLPITQDAYSPYRDMDVQTEQLQLPVLLDKSELELPVNPVLQGEVQQVMDTDIRCRHPYLSSDEERMGICMTGHCQIVYRDGEGNLQSENLRFEQSIPFTGASGNILSLWAGSLRASTYTQNVDELTVKADCPITALSYSADSIPMVTGLELGEKKEADPNRPSLILKRAGEEDLWSMAKKYGSTVDAIRAANQLTEDPQEGMLLLVPVC